MIIITISLFLAFDLLFWKRVGHGEGAPHRYPKTPSMAGGGSAMPGSHGTMELLWVACAGKGIPALLPAVFIACEQISAGRCDDAPPAATR